MILKPNESQNPPEHQNQILKMAVLEIRYELRNRRALVQGRVQIIGALFVYPPETQATE